MSILLEIDYVFRKTFLLLKSINKFSNLNRKLKEIVIVEQFGQRTKLESSGY